MFMEKCYYKIANLIEEKQNESTPVGYRYQMSFTIFVDGNFSTFENHKIADKIEDEIEEIYLTVIHVNSIEIDKIKTT